MKKPIKRERKHDTCLTDEELAREDDTVNPPFTIAKLREQVADLTKRLEEQHAFARAQEGTEKRLRGELQLARSALHGVLDEIGKLRALVVLGRAAPVGGPERGLAELIGDIAHALKGRVDTGLDLIAGSGANHGRVDDGRIRSQAEGT